MVKDVFAASINLQRAIVDVGAIRRGNPVTRTYRESRCFFSLASYRSPAAGILPMTNILFIHGMFLNPKSWQGWQQFFASRGFNCIAPAWPMHEGEPAQLRATPPRGLGELSLDAVIDSIKTVAAPYAEDLILVGHSVGGLIVQKLIAERIGKLGVAICSVAPNRMLSLDWGFFKNSALITNPLKGDAPFPMAADGFYQSFANTLSRPQSDEAWQQFAVNDSRNVLRDCMGTTGKMDLDVPHAPLLFISADKDEIIPPGLCEKNAKAYEDKTSQVSYREFKHRSHFICGEPAWEEVANHIAEWIASKSSASSPSAQRRVG
jgi:pimeloyl-ACP methyl ester carboxylesterase